MNVNSKRSVGHAVVVASCLLLAGTPEAEADQRCTLRSVRGDFAYLVQGTNLAIGLVSAVGRVSADGAGSLLATDTLSVEGTILRRTITGTYTIEPDCTGSVTFSDNFGQTTHLDYVLADGGDEIRLIQTDQDTIITGTARRL